MNTDTTQSIEQVLQTMDLTEDQKAYVYMTILEGVAKKMDNLVAKVLSVEDMGKIEKFTTQEEADAYIAQVFEEKTGRSAQEVSDALMQVMIDSVKKELLKTRLNN